MTANSIWNELSVPCPSKKYAETADTARKRWVDLMAPYDGWRIIDILIDVIQQADAAMQEAKAADNKWRQLMGF